ncbi:MAG TPA: PEP-CTERM sorting domain-containing protein [Verrucomicrobiae bacterium]|jgi:hypothetical protein|nr:PEP-CTERM sorting domain-containing protein [Verrucomicrobiae bacterium]
MRKYFVQGACVLAFLTGFCQCGQAAQIYLANPNLVQDGNFATLFGGPWNGTFGFPNTFYGDADGNGKYVTLFQGEPDMYQTITTAVGTTYQLTFASRIPQPGEFTGNTGPNGQPVGPWSVGVQLSPYSSAGSFTDNSDTVWSFFSLDFTATSTSTYLGFYASGGGNPEIDAISVYATPEPGTLGLLAVGAGALFFRQRKARIQR